MREEAEAGKYRDTEKGMERAVDRETKLKRYTQAGSKWHKERNLSSEWWHMPTTPDFRGRGRRVVNFKAVRATW